MEEGAPLVFLVAGEPSGDALGAKLMAALGETLEGRVRFAGVGGERMAEAGLESLFPMAEISVMGYAEVVPRIPRLLALIDRTARAARALAPDAVVTIDSPDFCLRVARRLRGRGVPLVHYVAPQVWAHRPGRAARLAGLLDHLLALLPFEPALFEPHGLACTFVGHPVVEEGIERGDAARLRSRYAIAPDRPLLCLLPGSRAGEVERHLPVMRETVRLLADRYPVATVLPTVPAVASRVAALIADWPQPPIVVSGGGQKADALAAADVALAASGTVTLELALAGLPGVVIYRAHPLTMWAARRLVRVPHIALANLVLDEPVLPEFIQEACRPTTLAATLARLLEDGEARARQRRGLAEAARRIGAGGPAPSARAARVITEVLAARRATPSHQPATRGEPRWPQAGSSASSTP